MTEVGPDGRVRVTCGLQHPISLVVPPEVEVEEGERVAIRVSSREPVRARLVDEPLPGFSVGRTDLSEALARPDAGVRVATSRHGRPLSVERLADVVGRVAAAGGLTVAFGAPERGLPAMLDVPVAAVRRRSTAAADAPEAREAGDVGAESESEPEVEVEPGPGFDLWLNTIPDQGSEVVRTEEAMFASLATLTLTKTATTRE